MKKAHMPERAEAVEMVMQLDVPFQTMAWMMLETGLKYAELQALRVRDICIERSQLHVAGRTYDLSAGLAESVRTFIRAIMRPAFEQLKRPGKGGPFTTQRLFPAWILDGYEDAAPDAAIPVSEFLFALQSAASATGYRGMIHSNTLRLVAAREWMRQGMATMELHRRLGHSDVMTTLLLAQTLQRGELTFAAAA